MSDRNDYKYDIREQAHIEDAPRPAEPVKEFRHYKRPSRFLIFILSWLPGLSHMYLGLIRRGIFYLSAFAVMIYATSTILGPLVIFPSLGIAGVYFTAFFEALRYRREMVMGREVRDIVPSIFMSKPVIAAVALLLLFSAISNHIVFRWIPTWGWVIFAVFLLNRLGFINFNLVNFNKDNKDNDDKNK